MRSALALCVMLASSVQAQVYRVPQIAAKDLYYSTTRGLLYASVGDNSPAHPNSIAVIDPASGGILRTIPVGLDPGKMAGSDDGEYLFVALDAESKMQRINLANNVAEAPFLIDYQPTDYGRVISYQKRITRSLKVIRGSNDTVIVSQTWGYHLGLAVYHNGIQLPDVSSPFLGCNNFTLTDSPDTLWCYNSENSGFELHRLHVDTDGVTVDGNNIPRVATGFDGELRFYGGLLYGGSGKGLDVAVPIPAIDPERRIRVGEFPVASDFVIDGAGNAAYFMLGGGGGFLIISFDLTRFVVTRDFSGSSNDPQFPGPSGAPIRMRLCTEQRALASIDSATGQVFIHSLSLLKPRNPVISNVRELDHGARALYFPNTTIAYDPVSDRVFASRPNWLTPDGNSITQVDPGTLTPGPSLWVGHEPSHLAISENGRYLYQGLDGANYIQRVNLETWTRDLQIPLFGATPHALFRYTPQPQIVGDTGTPMIPSSIVVLPGTGESIAVSVKDAETFDSTDSVWVFDRDIPRPAKYWQWYENLAIQLDSTGQRLYGIQLLQRDMSTLEIGPDGVHGESPPYLPRGGFGRDLKCQNDICIGLSGRVQNAKTGKFLGICSMAGLIPAAPNFTPGAYAVLPDVPNRRAYFVTEYLSDSVILLACSLDTFYPVEMAIIRGLPVVNSEGGATVTLALWRSDQFVFNMQDYIVTVPKSALTPVTTAQPLRTITSVTPNSVNAMNAYQTFTIRGGGFQEGTDLTVRFSNGTYHQDVSGNKVTFLTSEWLTAAANLGTVSAAWTVQVVNPNGSQTNTFPITVQALPPPAATRYSMPQFAYGGGWYTALYFSNTGTSPESFTVNFFSQNGNPLFVPLVGTAPASSKNVTLAPGSTVVLEAPNAGSLIQGWVDVTLPTAVIGYAIFRQSVPGRADQEAVVPLTPVSEKVASLSFDDTNLITTVGMLNPTNSEIVVIIEAYGPDGTFLTSTGHQLLPRSKTDFIVRNHVGLSVIAGKRGWLRFSTSTGALSVIGFRFGAEAFTSLPVDYGAATYQDFPTTFVLPQLAYGGGWYTALHFSSTRLDVTNVQVRFMSSEGSTLSVPLLGIGSASSQSVRLNPYSTAVLEAPNVGGLSQGWVEATVPSGVVGYAVFRQSVPGRADQEAVVLLTPQTSQIAEMIYDDTAFVTSVMYLNPTDQPVTVSVMAQGQDGAVVGTSQVALGPRTKQALTLRSLPGLQNVVGKRGRLQFSVPNPAVSVLGLRFGAEAFTSIPVTHR